MSPNFIRAQERLPLAIQHYLKVGAITTGILVFGVGGWATATQLHGAVIAGGTVVVESSVKKVQHPTGGIVGEIHVKEGDRVKAGDLVMRLDETVTRANLQVITKQLDTLEAQRARLQGERDGVSAMSAPVAFKDRMNDPDISAIFEAEKRLFESRTRGRIGQKALLDERISQLGDEVKGLQAQSVAMDKQITIIKEELDGVLDLYRRNLVPITRVNPLQREAARLEGMRGQYISSIASSRGKIAELEAQKLQVDQDFRTEVLRDLKDTESKIGELSERKVAAEDQLRRIDVRATANGTVHQLAVFTVGGVVNPSEPIMLIVPEDDTLAIDAKIQPQDIEQLRAGQQVILRFIAFNWRTTPEVIGNLSRIGADLSKDQQTGQSYYTVRVTISKEELAKLGGDVIPGMPVEAHIQTTSRTALSYLVKPLTDQVARAFKER